MKTKTNTKITLESSRRTIIRLRRPDRKVVWYKQCATETEMLAGRRAAIIFGTTQTDFGCRIDDFGFLLNQVTSLKRKDIAFSENFKCLSSNWKGYQLAVFQCSENGELHFIETASGALPICRSSLKNKNYKTKGV